MRGSEVGVGIGNQGGAEAEIGIGKREEAEVVRIEGGVEVVRIGNGVEAVTSAVVGVETRTRDGVVLHVIENDHSQVQEDSEVVPEVALRQDSSWDPSDLARH